MNHLKWVSVKEQTDIEFLTDEFSSFHDSCIKKMRFLGDRFVNENFGMGQLEAANLRVVFQRQWDNPSAIELEFHGIQRFSVGISHDHFPDIMGAGLFFHNEQIYLANDDGWKPEQGDRWPYSPATFHTSTFWLMRRLAFVCSSTPPQYTIYIFV